MKTPETIYHHLIDSFTHSNVSFALYRLPWTDEPILIMQEEGQPECISSLNELNQKKGFLLSPFHLTSFRPATLIRPDIQAHDWGEIKSVLQEWITRHPQYTDSHATAQESVQESYTTSEKEEKTCTPKHSAVSSCRLKRSSSENLCYPEVPHRQLMNSFLLFLPL